MWAQGRLGAAQRPRPPPRGPRGEEETSARQADATGPSPASGAQRPCPLSPHGPSRGCAPCPSPPPPPAASEPSHPGVDDQVRADVHLLQVGVALLAMPVLHLVRLVQVAQRRLGDVHPAGGPGGEWLTSGGAAAPTAGGPEPLPRSRRSHLTRPPPAVGPWPLTPPRRGRAALTRGRRPPPSCWRGTRRGTTRRTATCAGR